VQEQAETPPVDAAVVGDGPQVADAGLVEGLDECLGYAAQAESPDGQ
jgi:hypothetical protein